jgi:small-conductance mechanosensitive channel
MGLLYYPSQSVAAAVLRAVIIFTAVSALIDAVLERDPRRRLVELSDRSAIRISRFLQGIAGVYAADLAVTAIGRTLYVPLSMSVAQSLIAALLFAGLLIGILTTPFESYGVREGEITDRLAPRWVKVPLWATAGLIVVAAVLGYVALARFTAQQLVMTGVVALVTWLLFLAIRAFTRDPGEAITPVGHVLQDRFGIDASRRGQLARLTELVLSALLVLLAVPVLLLQWGFSEADVRDWYKAALFGFEIGHFKISLARILIGFALFVALLFATRLFQRWVRDRVLSPDRFDRGTANSIDTAIGYVGTALAALLSVAYAGFDVTNLAIVAGALSVGIGFGLQSIVNNFVSGLILLIERPIKVGDWVVVGSEQGTVKKISVRSTEIETFDRASLIVPNAEFITGRVLNWTHRNAMGRITIRLTTNGEADPRRICAILEECARKCERVLSQPPVRAALESISPSALEFSLRAHLADITHAADVQSELRIAALEGLRAAGVGEITAVG